MTPPDVSEPGTFELAGVPAAVAARPAVFTFTYRAGAKGVSPGGTVEITFPPLWNWQEGQTDDPRRADFVSVTLSRSDVTFVSRLGVMWKGPRTGMLIEITGQRGLGEGDTVTVQYGKETPEQGGVRVDRWASITPFGNMWPRFRCYVDPTGKGEALEAACSPILIDIAPDEPHKLVAHVSSVMDVGERAEVKFALVDRNHNAIRDGRPQATVSNDTDCLAAEGEPMPAESPVAAGRIPVVARRPGTARIEVVERGTSLATRCNPCVVKKDPEERIFWGDIHGHTNGSDGAGTPEDYFRYARDVAGLDFTSLTDHDTALAVLPERWETVQAMTEKYNAKGTFATLPGYEWSSLTFGHRNVYYRAAGGPLFSCKDEASNTPTKLWKLLAGRECIVVPHHPSGIWSSYSIEGCMVLDWSRANDELERLVEIFSCHGNSERLWDDDNFHLFPTGGHFVQDALDMGRKLGIIASSDSHNGHPGLSGLYDHVGYDPQADPEWLATRPRNPRINRTSEDKMRGCLVAVFAEQLSREAIYDALAARRCYATTGTRPVVEFTVNGAPMGAFIEAGGTRDIAARAISSQGIKAIEVFRNDAVIRRIEPSADEAELSFTDGQKAPAGTFYYVRLIEESGDKAWSSPVWVC